MDECKQYFPNQCKNLRACLRCRFVMTKQQFFDHGCPSDDCRELEMKESEGRVTACTTANFTGMVTILAMKAKGWVSRFNGLEGRKPGCYAVSVGDAQIPASIER